MPVEVPSSCREVFDLHGFELRFRGTFMPAYPSSLAGKPFVYRGRHPICDFRFLIDVWDGDHYVHNVPALPEEIFRRVKKG